MLPRIRFKFYIINRHRIFAQTPAPEFFLSPPETFTGAVGRLEIIFGQQADEDFALIYLFHNFCLPSIADFQRFGIKKYQRPTGNILQFVLDLLLDFVDGLLTELLRIRVGIGQKYIVAFRQFLFFFRQKFPAKTAFYGNCLDLFPAKRTDFCIRVIHFSPMFFYIQNTETASNMPIQYPGKRDLQV